MLNQYRERSTSSFSVERYSAVNKIQYAELLRCYFLEQNTSNNDNQLKEVTENVIKTNNPIGFLEKTRKIPLISNKIKFKCLKLLFVLRYRVPSKEKHSERYSYHMLPLLPISKRIEASTEMPSNKF